MLGCNTYTRGELDHGRSALDTQVACHQGFVEALDLTLVLDRYDIHRLPEVSGKDRHPLNEVELITESLMSNGRVFQGNKVIKYQPDEAVVKLPVGDPIHLTAEQFEQLAAAFFAELELRFVES